MLRPIRLD